MSRLLIFKHQSTGQNCAPLYTSCTISHQLFFNALVLHRFKLFQIQRANGGFQGADINTAAADVHHKEQKWGQTPMALP